MMKSASMAVIYVYSQIFNTPVSNDRNILCVTQNCMTLLRAGTAHVRSAFVHGRRMHSLTVAHHTFAVFDF